MNDEYEKFTINGKIAEDCNGNIILHNIKKEDIKRNPSWPELDWTEIEKNVGRCSRYEYLMCEGQCKTNEMAIKSIKNYRLSDDALSDIIASEIKEKRRNHYIRTHYNDIEDDNEERQEIRCLNG